MGCVSFCAIAQEVNRNNAIQRGRDILRTTRLAFRLIILLLLLRTCLHWQGNSRLRKKPRTQLCPKAAIRPCGLPFDPLQIEHKNRVEDRDQQQSDEGSDCKSADLRIAKRFPEWATLDCKRKQSK